MAKRYNLADLVGSKVMFLRTALVMLLFFGFLWYLGEQATPPTGTVFKRLAPIKGLYECCGFSSQTGLSSVNGVSITCHGYSYFPFGGSNRSDCGMKDVLNRQPVEVWQVELPYLGEKDFKVVKKISFFGVVMYEQTDDDLRELWIRGTHAGAWLLTLFLGIFVQLLQLVHLTIKPSNSSRK